MNIKIDLKNTLYFFQFDNADDLKEYINIITNDLDELLKELKENDNSNDDYINRLHDMLDLLDNIEIV